MTKSRNINRKKGTGSLRPDGYVTHGAGGPLRYVHRAIAEQALGRPLPPGAHVHHVDNDPTNNAPGNLVVCPDQAYHMLLHRRQRAFNACGNYGWRKCQFCKQYDDPELMYKAVAGSYSHRLCRAEYQRARATHTGDTPTCSASS